MSDHSLSLLSDPLLTVDCPDNGRIQLNICQALAEIGAGLEIEFATLRSHQFHAWYSSLVMIAALALHISRETKLPDDESCWREMLLVITNYQMEPWCLLVEDVEKPAFFQPGVPEKTLDALKATITTPDLLDVLITAKNHDLKRRRVINARPEHWIYALVTLQTMQGFLGAGNYGISRMNGGFSSRPALAAAPGLSWPKRFARDVATVLADRDRLVAEYGYQPENGLALVWLRPWDGVKSIAMSELDPFYVEICRRVRLVQSANNIAARTAPTKTARIDPGSSKGDTGDPWTPVKKGTEQTSLTVSDDGFSYKLMNEILFSKTYGLSPTSRVQRRDPDRLTYVASVLVRGSGRTEGYHERAIPVPPQGVRLLSDQASRTELGVRAQKWVTIVAEIRSRILFPAICLLLQGAPEKLDLKDERARVISRRLDKRVDPIFFDRLWSGLEIEDANEADANWKKEVVEIARSILDRAIHSAPLPTARRYKAIAAAEGLFYAGVRKHIPEALQPIKETTDGATRTTIKSEER